MRSSASSCRARSWASWLSVLVLFAGCDGTKRWPRGESPEYTAWRGKVIPIPRPPGVPQETVTVSLENFIGRDNEDWVEVAVHGEIVKRFNTHSPTGKPLILICETAIPAGILSVRVFDTVANRASSLSADSRFGTIVTVRGNGAAEASFTQARRDGAPSAPVDDAHD